MLAGACRRLRGLSGPAQRLVRNEHGGIYVEYVVVLSVFALVCAGAIVAVGLPLVRHFQAQVAWLILPIP